MTPDLKRKWEDLCERWERAGYAALSDDERVWLNVRALIDSIENGGLISYFYDSGADTLPDCRSTLRQLGADALLARVERVAALFGPEVPPTMEERNRILDSWSDDDGREAMLEDVDEEVMPMLADLEEKLESFLVHAGIAAPR